METRAILLLKAQTLDPEYPMFESKQKYIPVNYMQVSYLSLIAQVSILLGISDNETYLIK